MLILERVLLMCKWAKRASDRRGEMGVGTLIIFIAMVLVAAVAASVLINVVDNLQEQASDVAEDTQEYFNRQLDIYTVYAVDTIGDGTYDKLVIGVKPHYFSGPVDTLGMVVMVDGKSQYFNSHLEDLGEIDVDQNLDRYVYQFDWHKPSGLDYADGDRYLKPGQSGVITLGDLNEGFQLEQGDTIKVTVLLENGLPSEKRYTAEIEI